jgi:hypothetical protein
LRIHRPERRRFPGLLALAAGDRDRAIRLLNFRHDYEVPASTFADDSPSTLVGYWRSNLDRAVGLT